MARDGLEVVAVDDAQAAVAGADIVCCATTAMKPVFDGEWLEDGQLVVSIANSDVTNKRSEVDRRTYERATPIIVNDWESVIDNDQTELLDPIKEGVIRQDQVHELGDLVDRQGDDHAAAARRRRQGHHLFQEQFRPRDPVRRRRRHRLSRRRSQQGNNKTIPTEWLGSDLTCLLQGRVPALAVTGDFA